MEKSLENYKLEGKQLEIIIYPDPVLTTVATEVTEFNEELKELATNMLYTMYKAPGIGLAGPQIGISKRIFVVDVQYDREETEEGSGEYNYSNFKPMVFINPKFIKKEGETSYQEGCLSLPGIYEDITRADIVEMEYQNTDGEKHTINAEELLSICLQHEYDHLDGILFIDKLSQLKKGFYKKKLLKEKKKRSQGL